MCILLLVLTPPGVIDEVFTVSDIDRQICLLRGACYHHASSCEGKPELSARLLSMPYAKALLSCGWQNPSLSVASLFCLNRAYQSLKASMTSACVVGCDR